MPSHGRLSLLALINVIIVSVLSLSTNGALLPVQSASSSGESRDLNDGRLPRVTIPSHYDIEIAPDIYQEPVAPPFNFTGQVTIFVNCTVASDSITLNSEDLDIISVSVLVDTNSAVQPVNPPQLTRWTRNDDVDFLILSFTENLEVGVEYVINVTYQGVLFNPQNRGIYYDEYLDDNNVKRYMVATQLESIFARRMFPSFDEPDLKATFSITVLRKEPMISLSNMNLLRNETRENGWIADYYAKSPIMPTYLVCVCIGNFVYVETEWQKYTNHEIRIYSRPEMRENLRYAASIAPVIHAWLENETGIPYGLPKMDHIALPSKGGSAMENWGLITYGEPALCVNPNKTAATGKMGTVAIVAHELAHQWYGNIVTCKWWDDIWLNEGFANHYNYYPQDSIGWPGSEGQHFRGTQPFLENDQRNNSDPVIKNIDTSAKAPSAFTGSTYPKGGAIVRMIKGMLTRKSMNAAFTTYLKKFNLQPVTSDDLWEVLTEQAINDNIRDQTNANINFKTIMDPWMKQMGYPLVSVTNAGDGTATVTATRYFNPRGQIPDVASDFNYQWTIPVTVATEATQDWENLLPTFYFHSGQESSNLTGLPVGLDKWFVINANQMFFYRVHYNDSNTRAAIVNQLLTDHTKISSESRSQLVDDSFSLSRSLVIDETEALELTRYLGSELQYSAWNVALKHLLYADKIFEKLPWYALYKSYVTSLLVPVYDVTGWVYNDDEPAINQYLRRDISTTACYYGHPDCRSKANEFYSAAMQNPEIDSVDPNNLRNVLCVGLGDDTDSDTAWNTVYDEYLRRQLSPINDERQAYLYGLSCTRQLPLLRLFLERIVGDSPNQIPSRDKSTALTYLLRNSPDGRNLVWIYLRDEWDSVPTAIGKYTLLREVASTWYRDSELSEFEEFVTKNQSFAGSTNLIVQIQLLIEQNIEWFNVNAGPVEKWLRNITSTPDQPTAAPTDSDPLTSATVDSNTATAAPTESNPRTSAPVDSNTTPPPSSSSKHQVQVLAITLSLLSFIIMHIC